MLLFYNNVCPFFIYVVHNLLAYLSDLAPSDYPLFSNLKRHAGDNTDLQTEESKFFIECTRNFWKAGISKLCNSNYVKK